MASDSKSRFLVAEGPGLSEFLEARSDRQLVAVITALREAIYMPRHEMMRPYLLQHCQHPFAERQPDGSMALLCVRERD